MNFAALASSVGAALPGVRACLLVSEDGQPAGAGPAEEQERAMAVWERVSGLGDVYRGFTAVGEEVWVFCRRNGFAALALATDRTRPVVVLDRLERLLVRWEKERAREAARPPDAMTAPTTHADPEGEELSVVEVIRQLNGLPSSQRPGRRGPDGSVVDTAALAREFTGLLPDVE